MKPYGSAHNRDTYPWITGVGCKYIADNTHTQIVAFYPSNNFFKQSSFKSIGLNQQNAENTQ